MNAVSLGLRFSFMWGNFSVFEDVYGYKITQNNIIIDDICFNVYKQIESTVIVIIIRLLLIIFKTYSLNQSYLITYSLTPK